MDFKKFILENKKAIAEIAKQNAKYDKDGRALLAEEDIKEECWDEVFYRTFFKQ